MFTDVKTMSFDDALAEDMVDFIEDWLYDEYYTQVLSCGSVFIQLIIDLRGNGNRILG